MFSFADILYFFGVSFTHLILLLYCNVRNKQYYYYTTRKKCQAESSMMPKTGMLSVRKSNSALYHLDPEQHQVGLVNVVTGKVVVHVSVKANNATILVENQMEHSRKAGLVAFIIL